MDKLTELFSEIPSGILMYLFFINLIAFCLFTIDKLKAITDRWRISEKTLLGISFLGGALGGILAMHLCRHKIRKPLFRYGMPLMVVIHIVTFLIF